MQRFLIGIFLFTSLLFVAPSVNAQINLNWAQPGVNCGTLGNKCCYNKPVSIQIPNPNTRNPIDGGVEVINKVTDFFVGGTLRNFNRVMIEKVPACIADYVADRPVSEDGCTCVQPQAPKALSGIDPLCKGASRPGETWKEEQACLECASNNGVWTGLGCVKANIQGFIQETILVRGVQLAGVLSLFCIMYAAYMMQTSRANPEKIKKSQELLTSCIMGLLLIIFSIFILRIIGVNILRIPGFGT